MENETRKAMVERLLLAPYLDKHLSLFKVAGESSMTFGWLGRIIGSDGVSGAESGFLQRAKCLLFD